VSGRLTEVLYNASVYRNEQGEVAGVFAAARDITERARLEEVRLAASRYARSLIEASLDPLVTISADGKITDVNVATVQATGVARDALVGKDFSEFFTEPEKARAGYEEVFAKGLVTDYPLTLRHVSGKLTEVLYNASIYRNEKGDVAGVFAAARDITERARLEEERLAEQKRHAQHLEEIAHHDSLTGLPNRLLLSDRLHQAIAQTLRAGTRIAVCYLDLDGFKEVNDRLGHEAGDQVLVEVANRLMACVRGGDTVARLGGDEFVVLLSGLADDEECRMALERLLQTLLMPYLVAGGSEGRISASIGVTVFPSDRADADTLVRHADHAMYAAKQAGKGRYQMFDIRLEQRIEARHATLRGLADALQSGQFRLHYQPKVDCRRGSVVGVEALIRWQHPTLGLLSPAEFVPLIEDTDLAPQVGEWVILEALSRIGRWRREGVDIAVSVNAFVRQLLQPGFAERLGLLLEQYPEAAEDRLQIEIVETAALKELDAIRQVIEDCRKLGVAFSLDDFGTGYSTLAHLRHLPVTEIKIDQSFVGQMLIRPEDLVIVEAVIGLSRAFDRSVVAEGAETPAHIVRLLELGCDVMQGYALARPMIGDDIPRWVHEFRPDPAWYPPANGVGKV
jgi:diguanylate cyclase (GGDEF)-like protein/PAS domain S-box-containing protein